MIPVWPDVEPDVIRRLEAIQPPVITVQYLGHGPIDCRIRGTSARGRLQVTYQQRPLSLIQQLRDCHEYRRGNSISFTLPDKVFEKYPNRDVIAPADLRWRFARDPEERDHGPVVSWSAELLQVI